MKLLFRVVFANWPIRVPYHERGINSIAGRLLHKIIKCYLKYTILCWYHDGSDIFSDRTN